MKLFINASLPTSSSALKRVNILFDEEIKKISVDEIILEEEELEEEVETIDLRGRILLPGAIEIHNHIVGEDKSPEDALAEAGRHAIKGGWTTMAEMSYFSKEPIFTLSDLRKLSKKLKGKLYTDTAFWAHVDVTDYPYYAESAQELWAKGVVGISLTKPTPNPNIEEMSFDEIMDLFMDIYESDTTFSFQGWDTDNHKEYSFEAQENGIKKILRRMQENPIHIPRVSSYPNIDFINGISRRSDISFGMDISDLMHFLQPDKFPIRWRSDFNDIEHFPLLFELLKKNRIYLISNNASNIECNQEVYIGNPAEIMQYSYLWILSELWKERKIPLSTCVKMTSENPAKRLGLYPQKGRISVGSDADFVIYDPNETTAVTDIYGNELTLTGAIESVWLRGNKVDSDTPPAGKFLERHTSPKRRYNKRSWM